MLFYSSIYATGLESAKCENYEEAFACFLAAAQQGYNKAQFNVGVCYEKGRGVKKDQEKVGSLLLFGVFLLITDVLKEMMMTMVFFSRHFITTNKLQAVATHRRNTDMQSCCCPAGGIRV